MEDVWTHVQAFERKLDKSVNFLVASVAISAFLCFKALETNDHDSWHSVNLESLRGLDMLLALAAVPFVVCVQGL